MVKIARTFVISLCLFILAACQTIPESSVAPIKVVSYDLRANWTQERLINAMGLPYNPEKVMDDTRTSVNRMLGEFNGPTPVRVEVIVEQYYVPKRSTRFASNVLFGVDSYPYMSGKYRIVHAETGAVIKESSRIRAEGSPVLAFTEILRRRIIDSATPSRRTTKTTSNHAS